MFKYLAIFLLNCTLCLQAFQLLEPEEEIEEEDNFNWRGSGTHFLPTSHSEIKLPTGYVILFGEEARDFEERFLHLGEKNIEALAMHESGTVFISFSYFNEGYVAEDKEDLDFQQLMQVMREEPNEEGVSGWAEYPTLNRYPNTALMALEVKEGEESFVKAIALKLGREGYAKIVTFIPKEYYYPAGGVVDYILRTHAYARGFRYKDHEDKDKTADYTRSTLIGTTLGLQFQEETPPEPLGLLYLFKRFGGLLLPCFFIFFRKTRTHFSKESAS